MISSKVRALAAGVAFTTLALAPALASAQNQGQPPLPSYATGEETIRGTISQVAGKYQVYVRDDRGFIDNVTLHDGTVINPRGLTLASGQTVTILGHTDGNTFRANEIDTPYRYGRWYARPYYAPAYFGPAYYGGYYGPYWGPRYYGRFYGRFWF